MNPSLMARLTQGMQAGNSPMNTVTSGSPNFQPSLQSPTPSPMPNKTFHLEAALKRRGMQLPPQLAQQGEPQAQGGQVTLPNVQDINPQQPGVQVPLSEVELIIKALSKHLDHKNKMEAKVLEAALPQQDTQPQLSIS